MDKDTLAELFRRYGDDVFRLAYSYLGSRADGEDVCQTVFLKLAEGKTALLPGREKAWLLTCAANLCRSQLRSFWRRNVGALDESVPFPEPTGRAVWSAVQALPPKYRAVKDGHVWLEAGGKQIDITGKTNENTPYILERTDPATGNKGYLVVGGPAEDLGWVELVQIGDTCAVSGENFALPGSISLDDIPEGQLNEDGTYVTGGELDVVDYPINRPWLDKALKDLDLDVAMGLTD